MRATNWVLFCLTTIATPVAMFSSNLACSSSSDGGGDDGDDTADDTGGDTGGDDTGDDPADDSSDDGSDDGGGPDGSTGGEPDAGGGPACASPGAEGNEIGVGRYCTPDGDECADLDASICTVAIQDDAPPFCTKFCFSDDDCGSDATCEDNGGPVSGCAPLCLQEQ